MEFEYRSAAVKVRSGIAVLLLVSAAAVTDAAELKPDTVKAWDAYIRVVNSRMHARLQDGRFLWIDDAVDRTQRVRGGEVLVTPVGEHNPKRVSDGLIHDWIGAAFIPNARTEDVIGVIRDYGRYKEIYKPSVIDSKRLGEVGAQDKFSMRLLNKAILSKIALDSEYESSFVSVDEKRWYGVARTTRVREIENFGEPGERELPPDEGCGYIWRLYSLFRLEQRDGGVYFEVEAVALSRDIPFAVRWMVDPIVRRVSRGSLFTTLEQTSEAVRSGVEVANRGTIPPAGAAVISRQPSIPARPAVSLIDAFRVF